MSIAEKLTAIAENEQKVYDAGFKAGQATGGGDSHYDTFWDSFQDYGNRTDNKDCGSMFSGYGWNNETLKPKYVVRPTNALQMFYKTAYLTLDLSENDRFDFSNCTTFQQFINGSQISGVGEIDATKTTNGCVQMFQNANNLKRIKKLKVGIEPNNSAYFNATFHNCTKLEELTIDGSIEYSALDLRNSSLLNKASIISVVEHLSDTTSSLLVTLPIVAVRREFSTSEGANDGNTSEEWLNLVATKPNWTINLY